MHFLTKTEALLWLVSLGLISTTQASPIDDHEKRALLGAPTVTISHPQATVVGASSGLVETFKGIPFAQPPVGQLRLQPPQAITQNLGTVKATGTPASCPQQYLQTDGNDVLTNILAEFADNPFFQNVTGAQEDCLTLNIFRPSTATASSKLPVLFWIYGGGFEFGSTQTYDATQLVEESISQGKPIVYVAVNYRLSAFGFLGGSEIKSEGVSNLGLLDQRAGLQWVADNIAQFGGDPSKVTIWGESAGSISVLDQMILYNGDNTYNGQPLFRGAIMDSGNIVPANPVDCPKAQLVYDTVVKNAGCSGAKDTLACLRSVPYETFLNAQNSVASIFSYDSVSLAYLPRPDGKVLVDSPEVLVQAGNIAKVPFIVGDQEDEGTLFALLQVNLTTTQDLYEYFETVFFPGTNASIVKGLVDVYPDDPAAGSPFGTGDLYNLYPQQKRLAAILGDITFTIVRRTFLLLSQMINPDVPSWSYLASYDNVIPILGTFHATDLIPTYGIVPGFSQNTIQSYYLSFVNTLDPNDGTAKSLPNWPQWSDGNQLLHFNALSNDLLADDFRNDSYTYLINTRGQLRI